MLYSLKCLVVSRPNFFFRKPDFAEAILQKAQGSLLLENLVDLYLESIIFATLKFERLPLFFLFFIAIFIFSTESSVAESDKGLCFLLAFFFESLGSCWNFLLRPSVRVSSSYLTFGIYQPFFKNFVRNWRSLSLVVSGSSKSKT